MLTSLYSIVSFPADWLHHHRQADCLTILPMSFILGTQSRQCSKLTSNFHHHIVCLERQLWILRWHLIYGYNNLLLHHSLGLMSSPSDCILMEPLDKICRDHHQHFDPFQDINWIHDEKYPPCPWWFVLSSTTLLPSVQHKLVRVSSNPIAFKLMVDISFLDYWLLNHLSNIDHAT